MNRHHLFLATAAAVILLFSLVPTLRGEPAAPALSRSGAIKTLLSREVRFDHRTSRLCLTACGLTADGVLVFREEPLNPAHYYVTKQHYWIELEGRYQRSYFYVCYRDRGGEYVLGELLEIEYYSPFMETCSSVRLDIPWRFDFEHQSFILDFATGDLDQVPPPYQEVPHGETAAAPVRSLERRHRTEQLMFRALHGDETARKTLETNGM